MLMNHIDEDEKYQFVANTGDRLHLVFATRETIEQVGRVKMPLWSREAGDDRTLRAMVRWAAQHRAQWQEWGRLAEAIGHDGFREHIDRLWAEEPPALTLGETVTVDEDPAVLVLGEMVDGPDHHRFQTLYAHRFPSAEIRTRFLTWFYAGRNSDVIQQLVGIAYAQGTAALGAVLNDLAANAAAGKAPRGRRRGRRVPMAA